MERNGITSRRFTRRADTQIVRVQVDLTRRKQTFYEHVCVCVCVDGFSHNFINENVQIFKLALLDVKLIRTLHVFIY